MGTTLASSKRAFDYVALGLTEPEARYFVRLDGSIEEIQAAARRSAVEHAVSLGEKLAEGQSRFAHRGNGTFLRWALERHGIEKRDAYRAIEAWRLLKDCANVGTNFEPSALRLIAPASCPEPAKREALKLANAGKVVTNKLAKAIIEKHSAKPDPGFPAGYSPHGSGRKAAPSKKEEPGEDRPARKGEAEASVALDGETHAIEQAATLVAVPDRVLGRGESEPESKPSDPPTPGPAWNLGPGEVLQKLTRLMIAAKTWPDDEPLKQPTLSHLGSLLAVYGGDEPSLVPRDEPERPLTAEARSALSVRVADGVAAELVAAWNGIEGVRKCAGNLNRKRQASLRERCKEPFWREHWREAVARVASIPGLLGENDRGWRADIEWFLRPDSVQKLVEGFYDAWGRERRGSKDRAKASADIYGQLLWGKEDAA